MFQRITLSVSVSAGLLISTATADITTAPATTSFAPSTQGHYRTEADHAFGMSVYWENDGNFAKRNGATDRHYTAGVGITIQWQTPGTSDLVSEIPSINEEFDRDTPQTSYAGGVELAMNMYTPQDISDPDPIPDDHPYAGWTYLGLIAQRANRSADVPVFEHWELDLGTIGPSSQAGPTQQWIHHTFGYTYPEGWGNQIHDDFGADFKYQRRWRMDLLRWHDPDQFGVQLIPEAGFTAGTMHDNLNGAMTLRAGWHMPDDFGPNRLHAPMDFTRPFSRATSADRSPGFWHSLGEYFFVRPGGRLVAHDSTIDGSLFRNSPVLAASETAVAEIQAGLAIQFLQHWEFTYSQTYTSPEFTDQRHWDSFGALTLTYVLAW